MTSPSPDSFTSFGELLKHLRQRARLTQDEFALAVGYSRAHVARLESNQRAPDLSLVLARFAEALGLQQEPQLVTRWIELAAKAALRGDYALARSYAKQWRDLTVAGNLMDDISLQENEDYLLSLIAFSEGNYAQAQHWLTRDLDIIAASGGAGNKLMTSACARALGYALLNQGDFGQAAARLRESLLDNESVNDRQAVAACLAAYAAPALTRKEFERAARLFGASEPICDSLHMPLMYWDVEQVRRNLAALHAQLDADTLNAAWAAGRAMTYEQALAYAQE